MGKPYFSEIQNLPQTYSWAINEPIDRLVQCIREASLSPLVATGSGGSLSAAYFAAWLHQRFTGKLAKATTPLDIFATPLSSDVSALLLSAGGKNSDIIGAFRYAAEREPTHLITLCCQSESPLVKMAEKHHWAHTLTYSLPTGKDGFLSTNSLLALCVLVCRAYRAINEEVAPFPQTLSELFRTTWGHLPEELQDSTHYLWERETLLVLYGSTTQVAALDLESKFAEAALGTIQITDFRNFAHGRHNWLAKRGDQTGVLVLGCASDSALTEKTLALLPPTIPKVRLHFGSDNEFAALAALAAAIHIAGFVGRARGIDPGRPGIPSFGCRIYNLRAPQPTSRQKAFERHETAILARKTKSLRSSPHSSQHALLNWKGALHEFVNRMESVRFGVVVLDYDGTVCDAADRCMGWRPDIAREVERLLRGGIKVGVATGRGVSVQHDLRRHLPPDLWNSVLIGYYNGAYIQNLDEPLPCEATTGPVPALECLIRPLQDHYSLARLCTDLTCRRQQLTLSLKEGVERAIVWELVDSVVRRYAKEPLEVVQSRHSIDVLAPGVSKTQLLHRFCQDLGGETHILCIGDAGRWPGNDFALLETPYSLSSDETSLDPHTCWNLAPPGFRGAQATLYYLQHFKSYKNAKLQVRFNLFRDKGVDVS